MENKNGLTTFESAAFGNLRTAIWNAWDVAMKI